MKIIKPIINTIIVLACLMCLWCESTYRPEEFPAAPSNLTGRALSSSEIELTWQDNSDNEDGFLIWYAHKNVLEWNILHMTSPNVTFYIHDGLLENTTYYYRISSSNSSGNSTCDDTLTVRTEPEHVFWVSTYDDFDWAYDILVDNDIAYIADKRSGLYIVSISDIISPAIIGHWNWDGGEHGISVICLSGDYAYLAQIGTSEMAILDISNQANPELVSTFHTDGFILDIVSGGGYIYISIGNRIQIVNVENPINPMHADILNLTISYCSIYICDNYLFAGSSIYDIGDPEAPRRIGTFAAYPSDIIALGDLLYVVYSLFPFGSNSGLRIFEWSDPSNPYFVGGCDTPDAARGIYVDNNYAYVADSDGLVVIDVSDPNNPHLTGNYDTAGLAYAVDYDGGYIFVADYYHGIEILRFQP